MVHPTAIEWISQTRESDNMLVRETIKQIQHAPVAERIRLMELLLQSLKQDLTSSARDEKAQWKRFTVRPFDLGQEIRVDRDRIYAERSIQ